METGKKIAVKTKLPLLKGRGEVEINFETVDIYSFGNDLSRIINEVNDRLGIYIDVEPMDHDTDDLANKLEVQQEPLIKFRDPRLPL